MGLSINSSTFKNSYLSGSQSTLAKSLANLSSGLRINKASDDAAGLSIAVKLAAEEVSLQQSMGNVGDALSLTNVAEGALGTMSDLVVRGRELAMQASSGILNDTQRAAIQSEFSNIQSEIDRISNVTNFNGQALLDGSYDPAATAHNVQAGTGNDPSHRINMNVIPQMDTTALGLNGIDLSTAAGAQNALGSLDTALQQIGTARGDIGAIQGRLQTTLGNLEVTNENIVSAKSTLQDQDMARGISDFNKANILQQAGYSAMGKSLENQKTLLGNLLNFKA